MTKLDVHQHVLKKMDGVIYCVKCQINQWILPQCKNFDQMSLIIIQVQS